MFMVVSIPWPVASANVQFQGLATAANRQARTAERRSSQPQPVLVGAGSTR